ncbi:hydrogen peroxide-dependent heme synthase [Planctomycetota bacterium]
MSNGRPHAAPAVENSLSAGEGWHCSHLYYQFNRAALTDLSAEAKATGCQSVAAVLDPEGEHAPARLQTSIVSGQKADFGLTLMDPDPLKIDKVHQRLMNSDFGYAIEPTYSFVSISEISEYVPTIEQYSQRLIDDGEEEGSESFEAKLNAYKRRAPIMRKERLTPDFPDFPAMCFYPMNKKRKVGENWFTLPFDERNRMMNEHARSGMAYAGRVKQLITVGVGLEDWEWGVTLWAANPQLLTDIVYKMRFDEASARFAEFGQFFTSYVSTPDAMLKHCLAD